MSITVKTIPEEWQETVGRALLEVLAIRRHRLDEDAKKGWDLATAAIREALWLSPAPSKEPTK